ncbi:MAG: hypothetical protein IOC82_12050 [Aestuariivirga sp.]|nr:hypothetical protein [Aestuariivirga sp.]
MFQDRRFAYPGELPAVVRVRVPPWKKSTHTGCHGRLQSCIINATL